MRKLKYVKLFEAFESQKLAKTLKFVNKKTKSKFLEDLNSIVETIDFPISELSDKYFQYLPFKAALNLNQNLEDAPCDATSDKAYPGYGVSGETCHDGMVARKWGTGVRRTKCTICGGTGLKKKDSYPVKWVKFWFDKDGNYIKSTGVDGQIRGSSSDAKSGSKYVSIKEVEYVSDRNLTLTELMDLPTGSIVRIRINGTPTFGVVFNHRGGCYIIQDKHQGSAPDTREWSSYGAYSWNISSSGDYSGTPELLVPREKDIDSDTVDPYSWNAPLKLGYTTLVVGSGDVESSISGAHFAIVLDFLELSKSEFVKKSEISIKRSETKQDALAFKKDDVIKRENIQRYIDEISKKISISDDFKNFNMLIYRLLGLSYGGFYVLKGRNSGALSDLIDYTYKFMRSGDDEYSRKSSYDSAVYLIKRYISSNIDYNSSISDSIKTMSVMLKGDDRKAVLDKIIEINNTIANRIKEFPIENIEDMEVIFQKIRSIRSIWQNGERFQYARKAYYLIEYIGDADRAIRNFKDQTRLSETDLVLKDLDRFKRVIERI